MKKKNFLLVFICLLLSITTVFGQDLERLVGKEFEVFRKDLRIYVEGSSELIKNIVFYGQCNFEKSKEIYNKLDKIIFI